MGGPDRLPVRIGAVTTQPDEWLAAIGDGISASTVTWPASRDADPVVRDFVACCVNVIAKN